MHFLFFQITCIVKNKRLEVKQSEWKVLIKKGNGTMWGVMDGGKGYPKGGMYQSQMEDCHLTAQLKTYLDGLRRHVICSFYHYLFICYCSCLQGLLPVEYESCYHFKTKQNSVCRSRLLLYFQHSATYM